MSGIMSGKPRKLLGLSTEGGESSPTNHLTTSGIYYGGHKCWVFLVRIQIVHILILDGMLEQLRYKMGLGNLAENQDKSIHHWISSLY